MIDQLHDITVARRTVLKLGFGATLALSTLRAVAQTDVGKVILGFPAGAGLDPLARMVADKLRGSYLPSMIVENRAGAAGRIAVESLKRAPRDGSQLVITPASPLVLAPYTHKQLPYDPVADFAPVSTMLNYRLGLQVGPGAPGVTTFAEYLAFVRKHPKNAAFGSPGIGSMQHFLGQMFSRDAGVALTHVPYRGAPVLYQELLGGLIPAVFTPIGGDAMQRHKTGASRILAIASPTRAKELPDVPTFQELGFKNLVLSEWIGAFVPSGTPAEVINRLGAQLKVAMGSPDILEWCSLGGMEPSPSTAAELRQRVTKDMAFWKQELARSGFVATE